MLPVIALVGRPNVGKSTLFNRLTQTRDALVADFPGLTRDRQYGTGKIGTKPYLVIDTGGLSDSKENLGTQITQQALIAIDEADAVLFLVDAREGLNSIDQNLAQQLRRLGKPLYLVLNKAEHLDPVATSTEFYSLGLGDAYLISATHNHGVAALLAQVLAEFPDTENESLALEQDQSIRLALVGRPNVGKSTLINHWLGEERVLTADLPGTTRDSVFIPFEHQNQNYTLIDTAGVRRRSRVSETIEKFSIVKTLQSIDQAHVVLLLLDARQGIAEQDAHLLGHCLNSGRALVIAVNKWDKLAQGVRQNIRSELDRKLHFVDYARVHFISALHGSGTAEVLNSVKQAYASAHRKLATPELTRLLEAAVARHQPPLVHGHSIKLRYAHQGGQNPPLIVIHGNRVEHIPASYRRYLANYFRHELKLSGTPIRIEFKSGANPYKPTKTKRTSPKHFKNNNRRARSNK